jgi:hypothetical protein
MRNRACSAIPVAKVNVSRATQKVCRRRSSEGDNDIFLIYFVKSSTISCDSSAGTQSRRENRFRSLFVRKCSLFGVTMLVALVAPASAETVSPPADGQLICVFKRQVLFGANYSDYPGGPAYFGAVRDQTSLPKAKDEMSDPETEIQRTVDDVVKRVQGAEFTIDKKTGKITSIPFGPEKISVMEELPGKRNYARVFSPESVDDPKATYSVGYFDNTYKFLSAVMMVSAPYGGTQIFEYISLGEAQFGYCW